MCDNSDHNCEKYSKDYKTDANAVRNKHPSFPTILDILRGLSLVRQELLSAGGERHFGDILKQITSHYNHANNHYNHANNHSNHYDTITITLML